ncbi:uncharacterized protein LOC106670746 [Cimex lectularius]|uniref:CPR type cuticle protein n=1 Tax=Cimex lectularius TaxID=79782 RepID=A0A8I6TJS2_CIMLE|nr:uncharacterized protein LOC106670746 [Cimex lectularius]
MKFLVLVCAIGLATATPVHVGHVASQYHAQDELGQYSYGYAGGPSAKHETRTADGVTRGGYSYVDAHGLVQSAQYVSDPHNGFRVAATNLPVGPAVPAKPAVVATAPAVVAAPAVVSAPAVVAAAPAVVAAPAAVAAPAVVTSDLPEVVAARSVLHGGLLSHSLYGAHSWSGLVHALKKRSLAVVPTYTHYPGSTAPLVHAAPAVVAHTPVVAHSAVYPTVYSHWGGLAHVLKKRSLAVVATPLTSYPGSTAPLAVAHAYAAPVVAHGYAAPVVAHGYAAPVVAHGYAGPFEHPHVAAAKAAHLVQQHNEAVRNVHGVGSVPEFSPADAPDVALVKHAHLTQQVHEAVRNTHGLVKRHAVLAAAPLAYAAPVVTAHSTVLTHTPLVRGFGYHTTAFTPALSYHW